LFLVDSGTKVLGGEARFYNSKWNLVQQLARLLL